MQFTVLTLFPALLQAYFDASIMKRAVENELVSYDLVNIRDFAKDKHKTCDDTPFGGGAGMLMKVEPLSLALDSVGAKKKFVVYMTPSGQPLSQSLAQELTSFEEIVIICGRYEGIDQRIIDAYVKKEISIGDYVMSSGEVASMVLIDTVYRLLEGVISQESLQEESYSSGLLEYPQYTKPAVFLGKAVPPVLLSGNHKEIRLWRLKKQLQKTIYTRPDLLAKSLEMGLLNDEAKKMLKSITLDDKDIF